MIVGMLLHWRPRSFLRAAAKAVPMTGGVLLQFPLYAGIFGVLMGSGLNEVLARFFVSISTKDTLPLIGGIYSAILGLFLPVGQGANDSRKRRIFSRRRTSSVDLAWMVQVYNAAEALPNFINPFWMLPLMGLIGVKARDLAGYSTCNCCFMRLLFCLPFSARRCHTLRQSWDSRRQANLKLASISKYGPAPTSGRSRDRVRRINSYRNPAVLYSGFMKTQRRILPPRRTCELAN